MSDTRVVPHNTEAEESLLGAMLLNNAATIAGISMCDVGDFYRPVHGQIFGAICALVERGDAVDTVTVTDELARIGVLDTFDRSIFISLLANTPSIANARHYADIVRRESRARTVLAMTAEAQDAIYGRADPSDVVDGLVESVSRIDRAGKLPEQYYPTVSAYVDKPPAAGGVLVEGMLYGRTRIVVIASEKAGKSWLLRQMAMMLAAGIHPFNGEETPPIRVLILDAENDANEVVPSVTTIRRMIEGRLGADALEPALLSHPYGMDLRSPREHGEFEAVLADCRPQLIIGGPIYKLMPRREREDVDSHAAAMHRILDDVRRRWGCAIMLEHHAPTGKQGVERELRSKGGQQWAAWPEVTVALRSAIDGAGRQSLHVGFPHPPRGAFRWPIRFDRGTHSHEWPWTSVRAPGHGSREPQPSMLSDSDAPAWDEEPF